MKNFTFCLVIFFVLFINPAHAVIRIVNIPFTESLGSDITNNNLNENIGNDKPDKIKAATQTYADDCIPYYQHCLDTTLTEIMLSSTLKCIGMAAFYGCKNVKSLVIPPSVISIGMSAFSDCSGLKSLTLQPNLETIGPWAFAGCTGLTSLVIPSSVTTIDRNAFSGCTGLKSIVIEPGITHFGFLCFASCTSLTSISIPSTVTGIMSRLFSDCRGLTSLTIPASIEGMGDFVFEYCNNLKTIYMLGSTPPTAGGFTFYDYNPAAATLYVPAGSKSAYLATGWNVFGNIVEMNPTLLQAEAQERIAVYPNPVTDYFSIQGIKATATIRLTDINGKLCMTRNVASGEKISLESLPAGLYVLQLITTEGSVERKLVKR